MPVGRREKFWSKNCVAIGLSQGFAEPLEATAILISDYSAKMLADKFPRDRGDIEVLADRFNRAMLYGWDRVFDFIKMHYCVSDRTDSQFWLDNKNPETISDNLKNLLALWENHSPKLDDFFSKFEIFDVENYLYVLYGMKYKTKITAPRADYLDRAKAQFSAVHSRADELASQLPNHRVLLEKIKLHGLQTV
jgi:tryptophan halogenase